MNSETFQERLRRLRRRQRMTQTELGAAIGVAQFAICAWETGKHSPMAKHRPRLAKVLGVTEAYLRTGAEEPVRVSRPRLRNAA